MGLYTTIILISLGIISFIIFILTMDNDHPLFLIIAFIFIIGACLGIYENAMYLSDTKFKPEQIYILQGKVVGYDAKDKEVFIDETKLDGELLKQESINNITIGGNVKAKVVFCPSGKVGVLDIEKVKEGE